MTAHKHLWVLALLAACAAPTPRPAGHELVVVDADTGAEQWRGTAGYVLRPPARVIALPGVGELQVADGSCRLVWSRSGLERLAVLSAKGECAQAEARRVCFQGARFAGSIDGAARALVVTGCADENDLLESRLGGMRAASVGPVDWRRRCAPLPARARGCEVGYLALRTIVHDANPEPTRGFAFTWDGDRFRACFLERDAGRYRAELWVEDSCGAAGPVVLAGESAELD